MIFPFGEKRNTFFFFLYLAKSEGYGGLNWGTVHTSWTEEWADLCFMLFARTLSQEEETGFAYRGLKATSQMIAPLMLSMIMRFRDRLWVWLFPSNSHRATNRRWDGLKDAWIFFFFLNYKTNLFGAFDLNFQIVSSWSKLWFQETNWWVQEILNPAFRLRQQRTWFVPNLLTSTDTTKAPVQHWVY